MTHSDAVNTSGCHTQRLVDEGIDPPVGAVRGAYVNLLAQKTVGAFENGLILRQGPWPDVTQVKVETLQRIDWFNTERPPEYLADLSPA